MWNASKGCCLFPASLRAGLRSAARLSAPGPRAAFVPVPATSPILPNNPTRFQERRQHSACFFTLPPPQPLLATVAAFLYHRSGGRLRFVSPSGKASVLSISACVCASVHPCPRNGERIKTVPTPIPYRQYSGRGSSSIRRSSKQPVDSQPLLLRRDFPCLPRSCSTDSGGHAAIHQPLPISRRQSPLLNPCLSLRFTPRHCHPLVTARGSHHRARAWHRSQSWPGNRGPISPISE